jgi:hypothetical protein
VRLHSLSRSTLCILSCLVVLSAFPQCVEATPVVESSGSIIVDWDAGMISLDSTLTTGWKSDAIQAKASMKVNEKGIDRFSAMFEVGLGDDFFLGTSVVLDPNSATFTEAAFEATLPLLDANLCLEGFLEPGSFGSRLELASTDDNVVQGLSLYFNLDKYGRIQTSSCSLPFTYAEARFSIPLDCCEWPVYADISWDADGFSEFNISAMDVGGLPFGVSFGGFLTFTTQEKTLEISPSLNLESPECFDFYAGLVWDDAANSLSGIRFYGMGMRCEIGDIRFRMLYCFDPSTLALIKAPYKALLGLVWPMIGCCDHPGEGSVAFFFGENNLFDLEEILGELIAPVTKDLTLSMLIEYPMTGLPTFTFGWKLAY